MALIICRACGKTISDTAERCVHCGALTAPEPAVQTIEKKEEPRLTSFNELPEKTKDRLSREFQEKCAWHDPWLNRYRFFKNARDLLASPFLIVWLGIHWGGDLAYKMFDFLSGPVYHPFWETVHNVSKACALWLCLGIFVIVVLPTFYYRFMLGGAIYKKKLQKWLREEKQMDYIVTFKNAKAKQRFDSIDLENI